MSRTFFATTWLSCLLKYSDSNSSILPAIVTY